MTKAEIPKRRPTASSAFDPRFKDLFLQGRKEPFTMTFPSEGEARRFRQQAQLWRRVFTDEGRDPNLSVLLYQVEMRMVGKTLHIEPKDHRFNDAFNQIPDVLAPAVPGIPITEPDPEEVKPLPLDVILDELDKLTKGEDK